MKRTIAVFISSAILFSLAACTQENPIENEEEEASSSAQVIEINLESSRSSSAVSVVSSRAAAAQPSSIAVQPPASKAPIVASSKAPIVQPSSPAVVPPPPPPPAASSKEAAAAPRTVTVHAGNWYFNPALVSVKKGEKITLKVVGDEGAHGFAIPSMGINKPVSAGETITLTIPTDAAGSHTFFCSIQCGSGHSDMRGTLRIE